MAGFSEAPDLLFPYKLLTRSHEPRNDAGSTGTNASRLSGNWPRKDGHDLAPSGAWGARGPSSWNQGNRVLRSALQQGHRLVRAALPIRQRQSKGGGILVRVSSWNFRIAVGAPNCP